MNAKDVINEIKETGSLVSCTIVVGQWNWRRGRAYCHTRSPDGSDESFFYHEMYDLSEKDRKMLRKAVKDIPNGKYVIDDDYAMEKYWFWEMA